MTHEHWGRFAPSLAHYLPALDELTPVLAGMTSGPQPQARDYDPTEPEYLALVPDDDRLAPDSWVTITATGCRWVDPEDGFPYQLSFDELLAYLRQLPKRLQCYGRAADE